MVLVIKTAFYIIEFKRFNKFFNKKLEPGSSPERLIHSRWDLDIKVE